MKSDMILAAIDSNRDKILARWLEDEKIVEILNDREISLKIFKNHFATKILDYFIEICQDRSKIGDCPAVGVMLMFFEHKKMALDEVFYICDNMKKSVLTELLLQNALTQDSLNDVFNIFVENFSAIIREYLYKYCSHPDVTIRDMVCSVASTSENINECLEADSRDFGLDYFDDFDRQINQITTEDDEKTNNVDFGQADVEVIAEISENLEKYIEKHHVNQITKAEIQNFVDNIARLGGRLEILGCAKLGNLFMSLSATVSKYSEAFEKNFPSLIFLFEAMLNDLIIWENAIKERRNTAHIEKSIVVNLEQIQAIIVWKARS